MKAPEFLSHLALIPVAILVGCGGATDPPQLGNVRISTLTTGEDLDLSAYRASVGSELKLAGLNDVLTFVGIPAGTHTAAVDDIAENCTVDGGSSRQVEVTADATAEVTFQVSCTALPPAEVDVTGEWSGPAEGCDNTLPRCEDFNLTWVLQQTGDDVTGHVDYDIGESYELTGRVSGTDLTFFYLGWTRPATGYQFRVTSTAGAVGDTLTGSSAEQMGEWRDTFRLVRQ